MFKGLFLADAVKSASTLLGQAALYIVIGPRDPALNPARTTFVFRQSVSQLGRARLKAGSHKSASVGWFSYWAGK